LQNSAKDGGWGRRHNTLPAVESIVEVMMWSISEGLQGGQDGNKRLLSGTCPEWKGDITRSTDRTTVILGLTLSHLELPNRTAKFGKRVSLDACYREHRILGMRNAMEGRKN
jgi:hypothetical protein